jgi:hypothetical protein
MKTTITLFLVITGSIALSACRRDYTCYCYDHSNYNEKYEYSITANSKAAARKLCYDLEGFNETCDMD